MKIMFYLFLNNYKLNIMRLLVNKFCYYVTNKIKFNSIRNIKTIKHTKLHENEIDI